MIVCLRAGAQALGRSGGDQMASTKDSMDLQLGPLEAIESLHWWIRAGVTDALDDLPHDRFADSVTGNGDERSAPRAPESMRRSSYAGSETAPPARQDAAKPPDAAESSARALAQAATDLEMLRSVMAEFDGCGLKRTATQLVFADGVPGSRVMFVGEAPGEGEDQVGRPFVGRAGQLLDRMLSTIGRSTEGLHRECSSVAATRQPNSDASGDADMSPFHSATDRPGGSQIPCLSWRVGDAHDIGGPERDYAHTWVLVHLLPSRRARDPRARYAPPRFPVAATGAQAICLGGYASTRKRA